MAEIWKFLAKRRYKNRPSKEDIRRTEVLLLSNGVKSIPAVLLYSYIPLGIFGVFFKAEGSRKHYEIFVIMAL